MNIKRGDYDGFEYPPSELNSQRTFSNKKNQIYNPIQTQTSINHPEPLPQSSNKHFQQNVSPVKHKFSQQPEEVQKLQESLKQQMIITEEQRVYIEILKNTLENKLSFMGIKNQSSYANGRQVDLVLEMQTFKQFAKDKENENINLIQQVNLLQQALSNVQQQSQDLNFIQQDKENLEQQVQVLKKELSNYQYKNKEIDEYAQQIELAYNQIKQQLEQQQIEYNQVINFQFLILGIKQHKIIKSIDPN